MVKKRTTKQLPGQGPEVSDGREKVADLITPILHEEAKGEDAFLKVRLVIAEGVHVSQVSRYD